MMLPQSIRWRLPLSYAGIALLTALALNVILLVTLGYYFQRLEQAYLLSSGARISSRLAPLLAAGAPPEVVRAEAQPLAALYRVRLRVVDASGTELADTQPPLPLDLARPEPLAIETPAAPATPAEPSATGSAEPAAPAPEATALPGEAAVFETVYGFDLSRRSVEAMRFELLDPASGRQVGSLLMTDGPAYGQDLVASVGAIGALAGLAAVALAAGAGWLVSRPMTRPLAALTATSRRMAAGDLAARAKRERADEIGVLAESFNSMASQVEATVHTLRRFIADAAHELHTPLTALSTDLDLAGSEADPERARDYVRRAQAQTERLAELSRDLLDLSRLEAGAPGEQGVVDLGALLREVGETYASRAEQAGLGCNLVIPAEPVVVGGSSGQLRRAVSNVLDNALKFTPAAGEVSVTLSTGTAGTWLRVRDTGIGIPAEDLPRLFGRFHRGRNTAGYSGSGLGLAIVQAIMAQHGGRVDVESGPEGTVVTLRWP